MDIDLTPTVTATAEKNPCLDEHHDSDGVHGLFSASGWCLAGWRWSNYHRQYGVILLNHFFGLWLHEPGE